MSSIGFLIARAAQNSLNAGRTGGIPEADLQRVTPYSESELPAINMVLEQEQVLPVGNSTSPKVKRILKMHAHCCSTDPVELDDMTVWVRKKLAGNNLGGLANNVVETGTAWAQDGSADAVYLAASVMFDVEYTTGRQDPEARN